MPQPAATIPLVEKWATTGPATPGVILADGCMDLVTDGGEVWVAGPNARAWWFEPRRTAPMWGMRFHPGLLPQLLGCPAHELAELVVPLSAVAPEPSVSPETLLSRSATWQLLARNGYDARPLRVAMLISQGGRLDDIALAVNWSVRQLRRLSATWFGYGPKHLQRVLRVHRAEQLIAQGGGITDTAAACGYADAAHLWRDRRDLATVAR